MARGFVGLLAALLALALCAMPTSASEESEEWDLVARMNQARASAGLAPLAAVGTFRDLPRGHSGEMAGQNRIYHTTDLAAVAQAATSAWTGAAENVGVGGDIPVLHEAFMGSSGHRANVLGNYRYVGVGVVHANNSLWVTVTFMQAPAGLPTLSPAPAAPTVPAVPLTRFAGVADADTSLAVSRRARPVSAAAIVVSRNDVFPDALAGGPLSGSQQWFPVAVGS